MSKFNKAIKLLFALQLLGAASAHELEQNSAGAMSPLAQAAEQCQERVFEPKASECGGHVEFPTRIAGGYDARLGEFPSFVSVSGPDGQTPNCGGTILKPGIIMTAAHCVYSNMAVQPTLKRPSAEDENSWIPVAKACKSKRGHDIAILRLERDIVFDESVQRACLPRFDLSEEKQAYAIGLGYLSDVTEKEPDILQVIPVKRARAECAEYHPQFMCFRSSDPHYVGDACHGDSGSAAIAVVDGKHTVFAVVAGGLECEPGNQTIGVYFDVYKGLEEVKSLIYDCEE